MRFQRNAWYAAALPGAVCRTLERRVILGEPVLIYRTENGGVAALRDRCPHRFAPLSRGTLLGDLVQCSYHGLRFDGTGQCVHNPHGDVIAPNAHVRSYPVAERHGLVWIWMGDPALADAAHIPDLGYIDSPQLRTVFSYMRTDYRYDILVDNVLDLSHADYLHVGSFTGGACGRSETHVREEGDVVVVTFSKWDAPAPPGQPPEVTLVDQRFLIRWQPGQVMTFDLATAPAGEDLATARHHRFMHIATPETEGTTHYFMSITRDFRLDDAGLDAEMAARQLGVIQSEDGPMLDAVDAEMAGADLMDMRPVILPTDKGALRVRRVMKRLLEAETPTAAAYQPPAVAA